MKKAETYKRQRFPPDVIQYAVWWGAVEPISQEIDW
jgi:hypothetical protein